MNVAEIQVSEETRQQLEFLKQVERQPTMDAVIQHLITCHPHSALKQTTNHTLSPTLPKMLRWTKADKKSVSKYQ